MFKNNSKYSISIFTIIVCLFSFSSLFSQGDLNKITNRLSEKIAQSKDNETELVWIYFTDKGKSLNKYFEKPSSVVSPKSLARRAKYYKARPLIDESDIPVNQDYIDQVEKLGVKVKHKTRWFNGISAFVKKDIIEQISTLPFVKRIDLVATFKRNKEIEKKNNDKIINENQFNINKISTHNLDYGSSLDQLKQINVPAVHDLNYDGSGVTIALMDAGFDNLAHEVFSNMKIIATWDFVNNDTTVANQADSGEGSHGTSTLSIIGGFKQGKLIGPAYGANYILTKTENSDFAGNPETPIEEDNWVAAAEWVERIGVDVTSTSLGYYEFDSQYSSYNHTWQDMDGNTTVITKAADLLASKGVVVVNSAGNDRGRGTPNTLTAPADGDSVITVGAVYVSTGNFIEISSYGPTADNRRKPDVMAGGSGVYHAGGSSYTFSGWGTSFSCPLVAGVAALILQKNPSWNPMQVREALRMTASRANNPDNNYGWGIINALNAANYSPTAIDNNEDAIPEDFALDQNYPNPFNPTTRIRYQVKTAGFVTLRVFNVLGNEVAVLVNQEKPAGTYEAQFNAEVDGRPLPSGVYFYRLTIGDFVSTKKMILAK